MSQTPVRLLMVTADNNNKFYNMTPQGDVFNVEFGRVGVTSQKTSYPLSKWHSTYSSKVKKGYVDVTALVKTSATKSEYVDIATPSINTLFTKLMGYAKKSITTNYTISSDAVTQAQVREAQGFLDQLTMSVKVGVDVEYMNKLLLSLYTVIPRKMKKVQEHLIHEPVKKKADVQAIREIIDNEQKTLDVMAGQVTMHDHGSSDNLQHQSTILDSMGLAVEVCNDVDLVVIRKLMAGDYTELRNAYRVVHKTSKDLYDIHLGSVINKKTDLFWHGSRNENWISILQTGLLIRPSNAVLTGAMFGHGIYFADKYRKSAGYTSLSGSRWTSGNQNTAFLALMEVHLGKQLEVTRHSHDCYNYTHDALQRKGNYDSVFAAKGYDLINNEYIVYTKEQSTIKYLVEVGK